MRLRVRLLLYIVRLFIAGALFLCVIHGLHFVEPQILLLHRDLKSVSGMLTNLIHHAPFPTAAAGLVVMCGIFFLQIGEFLTVLLLLFGVPVATAMAVKPRHVFLR